MGNCIATRSVVDLVPYITIKNSKEIVYHSSLHEVNVLKNERDNKSLDLKGKVS